MTDRSTFLFCAALLLGFAVSSSTAQVRESFESAEPTWQLAESDCAARVTQQNRTVQVARSGTGAEFFRIVAANGTYAYMTHEIPPARIIPELETILWVKADRPGLQLMARVVLPRTVDRRTAKPITTWIRGTSYQKAGIWQMLMIPAPTQLLERQAQVLRSQLRDAVDTREAYIDRVVLNAYAGPQTTNIWVDDLEINGCVAPAAHSPTTLVENSSSAAVRKASAEIPLSKSPSSQAAPAVQLRGATLLVDHRPFLPRIVTYRGESFEFLKALGCNVIELAEPPTHEQQMAARRLDLWLLSPPTMVAADPLGDVNLADRVLAWNLVNQSSDVVQSRIQLLKDTERLPTELRRPFLLPDDSFETIHVPGRIRLMNRVPFTAPREPKNVSTLLKPTWFSINAASPVPRAIPSTGAGISGNESGSLRSAVYEAIAFGARGIHFKTDCNLEIGSSNSKQISREICEMNRELRILAPWIAGGFGAEELTSRDSAWRVFVLPQERSRLLLAIRRENPTVPSSAALASTNRAPVRLIDPGASSSYEAYHVTPQGLQPLRRQRVAGGVQTEVLTNESQLLVLLTQDTLTVGYLQRALAEGVR